MTREQPPTAPQRDEAIQRLRQLGFAESEARVYVALLQHPPQTGYELARAAGVPRANVYAVLHKLEQRGAAARLDSQAGTRYAPVPFSELLDKLQQRYAQAVTQVEQALTRIAAADEPPPITQFDGYNNLTETAQHLLNSAQNRLILAIWPEEAKTLVAAVTQAEQRQVQITTLCVAGCRDVCGYCRGTICRYPFGRDEDERWLLLIADGAELLAGSVQPAGNVVAIRTRQRFLVQLALGYIRRSMAVATLITDLGLHLDEAMSPQTREALARLLPPGTDAGWLEHMRGLLRERTAAPA